MRKISDTLERFQGNDNFGNPKEEYIRKVFSMSDDELLLESEETIWRSAYAKNNLHSDYHWQSDVCYNACIDRDPAGKNYDLAYKKAVQRCVKW
jgi:hypothetical protein